MPRARSNRPRPRLDRNNLPANLIIGRSLEIARQLFLSVRLWLTLRTCRVHHRNALRD